MVTYYPHDSEKSTSHIYTLCTQWLHYYGNVIFWFSIVLGIFVNYSLFLP